MTGSGELTIEGTITLVEYLGSEVFLYVRIASGDTLLVQAPGQSQYKIHDAITLGVNCKDARYFNGDGLRLGECALATSTACHSGLRQGFIPKPQGPGHRQGDNRVCFAIYDRSKRPLFRPL